MRHNFNIKIALIALFLVIILLPNLAEGKSENAKGPDQKEENQKEHVVIGDVKQTTANSIVVEDNKGKKKVNIAVDKNTKVIGENKKSLKINSIKPKDLVAVISSDSASATESSKPKKAVKIFVKPASSSAQLKRSAIQGIITNISGLNITIAHQIHWDRVYNLIANSFTIVKIKGSKSATESATLSNLQVGQRIVAVGENSGEKTIFAKMIHVIPGKASGIFKKQPLATPSVGLSPSPTGVASPSATPTQIPEVSPTASLQP